MTTKITAVLVGLTLIIIGFVGFSTDESEALETTSPKNAEPAAPRNSRRSGSDPRTRATAPDSPEVAAEMVVVIEDEAPEIPPESSPAKSRHSGIVLDEQGAPVEGARIRVRGIGKDLSLQTDREGRFQFGSASVRSGRLIISAPGLATESFAFTPAGSESVDSEYRLSTGRSLSGVVLDATNGKPIEGVIITVVQVENGRADLRGQLPPVQTDEQGTFTLRSVRDGRFLIMTRKAGYSRPSQLITARTGDEQKNIFLRPLPSIRGRVLFSKTKEPITTFSVWVTPSRNLWTTPADRRTRFKTEDGAFEISVPSSAEEHYVFVSADGFSVSRVGPVRTLDSTDGLNVVVDLDVGSTLRGQVVDGDGKGIPGVRVQVKKNEGPTFNSADNDHLGAATTDGDGHFTMRNVSPGETCVILRHEDFLPETSPRFRVTKDENLSLATFQLSRGAVLKGQVIDTGQDTGGRMRVTLTAIGKLGDEARRETSTDANGRYEFSALRPGRYAIDVSSSAEKKRLGIGGRLLKTVEVDEERMIRLDEAQVLTFDIRL